MNSVPLHRIPTREIAEHLAHAAEKFPFLGALTAEVLMDVVRVELGDGHILDRFSPCGSHFSRAVAPREILHIVSGNTPHAALQSLLRGLLLGSHNRVKIPSTGLPEVEAFRSALPASLAERVEISLSLPDAWLHSADAVIVFGNDETIAHFRTRVPPGRIFQAHGHRVSFGIIFDDPDLASIDAAARDASLYDQQGCLSPHLFYINERNGLSARTYAARLAGAMEAFNQHTPRGPLSVHEAAAIADLRASYQFRSSNDVRAQIWCSEGSTAWTVVYEEEGWFASSPLNRFIFVKPLPPNLDTVLEPVRHWIGAIGIWPATEMHAEVLFPLGASRICPIGKMQFPPFTWHAEGKANLASLIRWVDFEPKP